MSHHAGAARVALLLGRSQARRASRAFYAWAALRRAEGLVDQIERLGDLLHGDDPRPRPARPEAALAALARTLARVATSPSANLQAAARARGRLVGRRVTRGEKENDGPEICPTTPGEVSEKELARGAARVRGLGAPMQRLFEKRVSGAPSFFIFRPSRTRAGPSSPDAGASREPSFFIFRRPRARPTARARVRRYADGHGRLTRSRAIQLFRDVDVVPALASDDDVTAALAGDDFDDFCVAVAKLGTRDAAAAADGDPLRGLFRVMSASRRFYEASESRRSPPKTPAHGLLRRWR